jgi:hypothetical protein
MASAHIQIEGFEWRLYHALALNVAVLVCAWRFARRRAAGDALEAMPWAMALWFAVQYVSVSLPAVFGILSKWTITVVAAAISAALWFFAPQSRVRSPEDPKRDGSSFSSHHLIAWSAAVFLIAYVLAILWDQRFMPPSGDDGLTYHLPAAVRWLRGGRFMLHEVWFLNPAATFNPLLGSTILAWWMAPLGNDYLARFVQVPALVLIFFEVLQLCRLLGARIAVAARMARPTQVNSQAGRRPSSMR